MSALCGGSVGCDDALEDAARRIPAIGHSGPVGDFPRETVTLPGRDGTEVSVEVVAHVSDDGHAILGRPQSLAAP